MGDVVRYQNGFTKGSKEKIEKALDKKHPRLIPPQLESVLAPLIQLALKGQIMQLELSSGPNKIRIIAVPADYGETIDDKRILAVPENLKPVMPAPQETTTPSGLILPPGVVPKFTDVNSL